MGKLIIDEAGGARREIPLEKERTTIGRHPDNDICLPDMAVSGRHAVVHSNGQDALLEDLSSTNGTLVNGRAISRYTLLPGDMIAIGRNRIVYASFEWSAAPPPMPMPAPPQAPATDWGLKTPTTPPRLPFGKLRIVNGPNLGKELELSKPLTTVGRPGQIVVAITRRMDGYFITHAGGPLVNPKPRVNGREITYTARKLTDSDQIEVAGTKMLFMLTQEQ
jgi:hypothetical protein